MKNSSSEINHEENDFNVVIFQTLKTLKSRESLKSSKIFECRSRLISNFQTVFQLAQKSIEENDRTSSQLHDEQTHDDADEHVINENEDISKSSNINAVDDRQFQNVETDAMCIAECRA